MSNKVQKTLTAALTATIATGAMAVPAMAVGNQGNVDDLYKAAFEATTKTQDLEKVTQADINAAREAINALRGTAVESAVPTFSSIVDKAQQQFLTVAYNSIVECQKTETQKDINTARTNIKDLPAEFKNAYSSAIDTVQQKKIDAVTVAVEKAEKSQKAEDIKAAQDLLTDILTVENNDGVKEWAVKLETSFKEATAKLTIVAAEALNNNSVKVVFNRAIDAKTATVENFSVTPKSEAYNNLYVGSVEVAEDGTSATLTLLNNLADKGDYVVNASKLKDKDGKEMAEKVTAEFKYEVAAVKSVEFTTTNIPVSADLKNYVIVKDAKGRNVTDEYKNKLTFTTSNSALVNTDGIAQKPADANKNTVMVGVSIDGTEINTSALLTISESAATSFEGFAVVKNECPINGKTFSQLSNEDKLSYVTVGQTDARLVVGFKNQFGKELSLDKSEFKVETNYNPTVAIVEVDANKVAHITALSEGTAYVKIKCGTIERTVAIQVKAAALPSTISTTGNSFNLVGTNEAGIKVDYTVNNQYGTKYTGNSDVTIDGVNEDQYVSTSIKDANGNSVNTITATRVGNQIEVKPVVGADVKTGTYTVTLTTKFDYKGKTTTLTKDITVNIVNGGSLAGYKVQINNTNLDVNAANENKTPDNAVVTVYEVDAQGNELGLAKDSKIEVLNSNGNEAKADEVKVEGNKITAEKDGVYTVKVTVGSYTVKQITINVVDTNAKSSTVVLNAQSATVDSEKTVLDVLNKIGYSVRDQFGKQMLINGQKAKITAVKCEATNQSGVSVKDQKINWTGTNVNGVAVNKGSFDLVINNVTVEGAKDPIYFDTPLFVQVTVNESQAHKDAVKAAAEKVVAEKAAAEKAAAEKAAAEKIIAAEKTTKEEKEKLVNAVINATDAKQKVEAVTNLVKKNADMFGKSEEEIKKEIADLGDITKAKISVDKKSGIVTIAKDDYNKIEIKL